MVRIEALLRKEIGLDAASIGSAQIQRTIRLQMKRLDIKKPEEYQQLLNNSKAELDQLVEAVVVTETWFFRDGAPFTAFTDLALQWLGQNPTGTLRALSIPCSSGEEPYSLAMALLDQNVAPHRFAIHGVDISQNALMRARHAVYGKNSFRAKDLTFRERHFHQTKEGYVLNPAVRDCVQFYRDNLLGETFLTGHAPYDFIFCRNLLIYFDRATQARALEKIHRLLTPNGVLFVGPAEMPLVADHNFATANIPMAFACRKIAADKRARSGSTTRVIRSVAPNGAIPLPEPKRIVAPAPVVPNPAYTTSTAPSNLDAARQLADAGRLTEAAAVCEEHLRRNGPSAEAFYLIGLVRDANGEPEAITFYRKALYLEPNHYETLLQMSLLLEKNGDTTGARTFKRRAEKAQPKS